MEHCRSAFSTATVHLTSTVPPAACSPAFHALVFLLHFFVSSHLVLVIVKCFCCFWYFHLSWWLCKPLVYTVKGDVFAVNKIRAPVLPFFFFSPLFSPFSATKHFSDDDNSKDAWIDLFLLEEEGYWALDLR